MTTDNLTARRDLGSITLRNLTRVIGQRGFLVLSATLVAMVLPRVMGPEIYGRYALLSSLAMWGVIAGSLGLTEVSSRYFPKVADRKKALTALFRQLWGVRLVSATGIMLLFYGLVRFGLSDLPVLAVAFFALALFLRSSGQLFFVLCLGIHRADLWGLSQVLRRLVSFAAILVGYLFGGLIGACAGAALTEAILTLVGSIWARRYVQDLWPGFRWRELAPYWRFGALFFLSDALGTAFQHSGGALIRMITNDYVEVGYFVLAHDVYHTVAVAVPHFILALAPLLAGLAHEQPHLIGRWVDRLLPALAALGICLLFGVLFLGSDMVPLVFGRDYAGVTHSLLPMMISVLLLGLTSIGRLYALAYEMPHIALIGTGIRLVAFWCVSPWLIVRWGSAGAALGVLFSGTLYAGYMVWSCRRRGLFPLRRWIKAVLIGIGLMPLTLLHGDLSNVLLCALTIGLYLLLLTRCGLLPTDWRTAWVYIRKPDAQEVAT